MPEAKSTFKLESSGALTTGVKDRWAAPIAGEVLEVIATVGTAPTGGPLVVELQKTPAAGGAATSIYTTTANRPTIAAGAFTSATAGATGDPDVRGFAQGDVLSLNIVTVGTTVAGSDLDVTVAYVPV